MNLYQDEDNPGYGSYVIPSQGSLIKFLKKDYEKIKRIIDCQNIVLKKLIPGMTLHLEEIDNDVAKTNEMEKIVIIQSLRNGVAVPLKYESDGIRKIIYILSVIIKMYNNPSVFLAIDEIDSGVFEYLLGALITTIEKSGKGQLLFTSHNLRPLELLNPKSVFFTTINEKNRYTQITGVRATNNVRKLYYTNIQLGADKEDEEDLYDMVDTYLIADSLKEAGDFRE